MEQDRGYSKQQIGSLTTDGEGEFRTFTCLEYSKKKHRPSANMQST